jgi:hypothetical protein
MVWAVVEMGLAELDMSWALLSNGWDRLVTGWAGHGLGVFSDCSKLVVDWIDMTMCCAGSGLGCGKLAMGWLGWQWAGLVMGWLLAGLAMSWSWDGLAFVWPCSGYCLGCIWARLRWSGQGLCCVGHGLATEWAPLATR